MTSDMQLQQRTPNNPLSICSQAHHRSHQLKDPSVQSQRSTGTHWLTATQIEDYRGINVLYGVLLAVVSAEPSAPVSRCDTHHHESLGAALPSTFWTKAAAAYG